jgi:glutathione S-transferase
MSVQTEQKPTLWQIEVSHYSEKVRWALEYKGVDHVRRTPLPGMHIPIALAMTRGEQPTFPVMTIDGRTIGDSTAIIAALEALYPEPPLYPVDAGERARALELEDYFDEQLGPHARLLPFYELIQEPELFAEVAAEAVPGPLGKAKPVVGAYARAYTSLRWGANSSEDAERWTASTPSWSAATASSWSASVSRSPTSRRPPSSTRWSAQLRARSRRTCPARRPSSASARASKTAAGSAGSRTFSAAIGTAEASPEG